MASTVDSPFLTQLGLTNDSFRATGGQAAANMLVTSLTYITNPTVSLELRTDIARKISIWQEKATAANKQAGFQQGYNKFIETIQLLLQHLDGHQPALHLAQALAKECSTSPISSYGKSASIQFMELFQSACSDSLRLNEATGSVFVEVMKLLVECFPTTGDEMDSIVILLFPLFFRLSAAPSLKGCIARKLYSIFQSEQSTPASPQKPSPRTTTTTTMLERHLDFILQAIRQGHSEFANFVLANKRICSVTSPAIAKNLPVLIESIGYAALEDLVLGLVEVEPAKFVPSLSALVHELEKPQLPVGQKVSILGVLLTVVLAQGAAPLIPLLDEVGKRCSEIPDLYIPLFKVLTSISVVSTEEVALKALVLVSTIAKNNAYYKAPPIQAAILDCVNILKDQCKYSNLFQSETLKVFEAFSVHNPVVYKNIILWNSGKSAKKGNNADFLLNAGVVITTDAPVSGIRSWFGSPKKVKSSSGSASNSNGNANTPTRAGYVHYSAELRGPENVLTSPTHYPAYNAVSSLPSQPTQPAQYIPQSPFSTPNKGNTVAPSPHSQSLALMQQQLYAQQQQLQHQMLLVQQMQIQEQLTQFQPVGSAGHAENSNNYGHNSAPYTANTAGVFSYQLLQSPPLLPPNIYIPNYIASTPTNNNNQQSPYVYSPPSNPYVLGVQSVSQPSVPLNMSPPPPQYSVNAQQVYTSDNYILSPVNNVYNKNYKSH